MKKRLSLIIMMSIIVMLSCICAANAQTTTSTSGNGGQYAENGSVKLQFGGLISGRKVWLKVYNKQWCTSDIKVSTDNDRILNDIHGHDYDTIQVVVPTNLKVKAKTLTNCGGTDFGWVELVIPASSLPVTITNIQVTYSTTPKKN